MNINIAKALFLDALYQVLDNKVFRILVILIGLLICVPILIAFKEDGISILFGTWEHDYTSFIQSVGPIIGIDTGSTASLQAFEIKQLLIKGYQDAIIEGLAGSVGMLLCIAATAFFMPMMLEKGAADNLFAKPVSRFTLLMARYITGLLFVFLLSSVLILGTHAALLLRSGESDPSFLWTMFSLTYAYGLYFSVTVVIGVFTRSTVASILLSLIFMTFNGCIHGIWTGIEHTQGMLGEGARSRRHIEVRVENDEEDETDAELSTPETQAEGATPASEDADPPVELLLEEVDDSESSSWEIYLRRALTAAHIALPKTGHSDLIVQKLRSAVGNPNDESVYTDDLVTFSLNGLPPGFVASSVEATDLQYPTEPDSQVVFTASPLEGDSSTVLSIHRRPLREIPIGTKGRTRTEGSLSASKHFKSWLEEQAGIELLSSDSKPIARNTTWNYSAWHYEWQDTEAGFRWHTILVRFDEHLFGIQLRSPIGWLEQHPEVSEQFGARDYKFGTGLVSASRVSMDPSTWYAGKAKWGGEWKFSLLFSIGTSVAFAGLMLALSWLRLRRIDF